MAKLPNPEDVRKPDRSIDRKKLGAITGEPDHVAIVKVDDLAGVTDDG